MRGFPLLQLLGIALLFVLAAIPVWKLTRPATALAAPAPDAGAAVTVASATRNLTVELHFEPAPADFELTSLGQPLLTGHGPAVDFSVPWTVRLPAEGADLALQAHWPASMSGLVSARVRVEFPDGHGIAQLFGGDAASPMVEVVTIKP